MGEKIVLVAYDIPEDTTRTRLAHLLQYFGLCRIQYSVFFGHIAEHHLARMIMRIRQDFGKNENRIMIQEICRGCLNHSITINYEIPRSKQEFLVI